MLIHHLEITRAIVFLDFMAKIVKEVIIVILKFSDGCNSSKSISEMWHSTGLVLGIHTVYN